ncbi:MAG: hypothetical protein WD749_05005 [Phycisphaerales bacterium]
MEFIERVLQACEPARPDIPGTMAVEVAFVPPAARRIESRGFGWPTDWMRRDRHCVYEDAVRGTGLKQARTNPAGRPLGMHEIPSDPLLIPPIPRWRWEGRQLLYRPPPEETGGVFTSTAISPPALAVPAAVLLLLWFATGALQWYLRRRGAGERRLRVVRLLVIAGAALVIVGLASLRSAPQPPRVWVSTKMTQVGLPPAPVYWTREGFARLSLRRHEIERLPAAPDGAQRLAKEIMQAAGATSGAPDSLYLAVGGASEAMLDQSLSRTTGITYRFPVLSVKREYYVRRPDFGPSEPLAHAPGVTTRAFRGLFSVVFPGADANQPTLVLSASLEMVGMLLVGLWLVWLAAWYPLVGVALWRIARREARGLCPRCGYPVVMPDQPPAT